VQRGRSRWRTRAAVCALIAACAVIAGCGGSGGAASPSGPAGRTTSGGTAAGGNGLADPPTIGSPAAACVAQVLGGLTLAQRVGQLFLVGVDDDIAGPQLTAAEQAYHFGSLLLNESAVGTAQLAAQTAAMQELARPGTDGVRFFIAANQEGGQVQQLTGPGFTTMPSELVQGTWPVSTLRTAATDWGTDLRAAGVNLDLAPVMDVVPQGDGGQQRADRGA
jgi:beta-N-acetylhexosaminidase